MRHRAMIIPGFAAFLLAGCATPPPPPPPQPIATLTLQDAMIQTVDALAATRRHAAREARGHLRVCEVEAVFHITALQPLLPDGTAAAARLAISPPGDDESAHGSTITLTLAGENCDEPTPPHARARRQRPE
ncbi:hypothetical protein [Sediminicoccus sp. KRV36]|uniref:hypothetical protein n=1 Tax=Sediminicoccus sp. KRV36 TaxID=3133721 RepID=UPI002010B8D8|nr:hypothetical protein [Sediminicoccus rosea]UPY38545.1 hypothetical protein LHU95_07575 [Sediminicoccus rosea]